MKIGLALLIIFISVLGVFAQKNDYSNQTVLKKLNIKEQVQLASLPELKLPDEYKGKSIPYEIDNTIQTCYSGLFTQSGYCCGQAACVANGFTYEINRVRELDGSIVSNKYPTHFAWNWENGGNGYYGASYYHSLSLLKLVGSPNMETYGGTHDYGGDKRFMSGYDAYYEAMQNRISKAYAINCSDEEGILTLKHWLNDHLDGSEVGGIAFFYSQHQNPTTTLPVGTEHAGEKVCTSWGTSPNHAMTITGYNDSIKWDYNGDGLYTNDIDINGDEIVDVRDWEIGGFKMCNTYGSPYNGWMMYRSLALASNDGGIWNNTANVVYPIKEYKPMLTYKVNLYYTKRGRIKILAGCSPNLDAIEPEFYLNFPILDYQGAGWGLQGENDEVSRHMELGLDVTPFLNNFDPNTPIKFFFQILENDDEGWGEGEIQSFSLIDYSGASPVEYPSSQTNVAVLQNDITTVSLEHTPNFVTPQISTSTLPNANVYHDYSYQMEASGGEAPYRWEFDIDYNMIEMSEPLSNATTPLSGNYIELPFDFEFYGETFSGFYLQTTGLIDFSGESYNLPYNDNDLSSNSVSFMHRKSIAAFFSNTDCDVYFSSGLDFYVVRWVGTGIDVSIQLESDGKISIYYNTIEPTNQQVWSSGLSFGNLLNYSLTPQSGGMGSVSGIGYTFEPLAPPEIFSLTEDGLLFGTPTEEIIAYPLNFKLTDARGMIDRKTIPISTEVLIIDYDITTLNGNTIEWGENVDMNLSIRNSSESIFNDLVLTLTCENTDVTINDGIENVVSLEPLEELVITEAFDFDVNYNFYNEQEVSFHLFAQTGASIWEFDIVYPVYTADINVLEYFVDDSDNNRLDIGETSDVYYKFENMGGAFLGDINVTVTSSDPFLTINDNVEAIGDLDVSQNANAYFNFTAHPDCLPGHVAILNFHLTGENGFEKDIEAYISIGIIVEDWESNTFESYNWTNSGDVDWFITDENPYQGVYCLKSGDITHEQNSILEIELQVISSGNISFYRKVSCEDDETNDNWDYLAFYIDDVEQDRWDGVIDWEYVSYPVFNGVHNFKWVYHKDGSVDSNDDCAWIDLIEFPSIYDADPVLTISASEINKTLYPDETDTEILYVSNQGGGIINYEIEILNDLPWLESFKSIDGSVMTCSESCFFTGDTVEWEFSVKNNSTDNEWIEELLIDFPEGFIIDSITDFYDQSPDTLVLISGIPGNGSEFSWFGENDDGWGVIGVGEIAKSTVYGRVSEDFENDMLINYIIQGEVYASEPHVVEDSIILTNFGPPVQWLTLSLSSGNLGIGHEDEIVLNFNTQDMVPGEYSCNIKIFANTDTVTIPVNLTVLDPVRVSFIKNLDIAIYPNPTKNIINILTDNNIIDKVEIFNSVGQIVFEDNYFDNSILINVKNFNAGVYFVNIYIDDDVYRSKIIVD